MPSWETYLAGLIKEGAQETLWLYYLPRRLSCLCSPPHPCFRVNAPPPAGFRIGGHSPPGSCAPPSTRPSFDVPPTHPGFCALPSLRPSTHPSRSSWRRCQRAFIEILRDMEPAEEETEAKLTPAQIMEFFEACDTLLALPG